MDRSIHDVYRHLLRPRSGGVALVLSAMGDIIDTMIDVTIVYPGGRPSLRDLFANRVAEIRIHVRTVEIPDAFRHAGDPSDPDHRRRFRVWLDGLWAQKDEMIADLGNP